METLSSSVMLSLRSKRALGMGSSWINVLIRRQEKWGSFPTSATMWEKWENPHQNLAVRYRDLPQLSQTLELSAYLHVFQGIQSPTLLLKQLETENSRVALWKPLGADLWGPQTRAVARTLYTLQAWLPTSQVGSHYCRKIAYGYRSRLNKLRRVGRAFCARGKPRGAQGVRSLPSSVSIGSSVEGWRLEVVTALSDFCDIGCKEISVTRMHSGKSAISFLL